MACPGYVVPKAGYYEMVETFEESDATGKPYIELLESGAGVGSGGGGGYDSAATLKGTSFKYHLHGHPPSGSQVRCSIEYRGDHPTRAYKKVNGTEFMFLTVPSGGHIISPVFSIEPNDPDTKLAYDSSLDVWRFKIKTQVCSGTADELKQYKNYSIKLDEQPTTAPTPPPAGTGPGDAKIVEASPSTNYGSAALLEVDNSPVQHSLLAFDISTYSGATINSAKVRLHCLNSSPDGGSFHLTEPFSESVVTWSNAPAVGILVASMGAVSSGTTYDLDVTTAMRDALAAGKALIAFRVKSGSGDGADYASKEHTTAPKPQLVVDAATTPAPAPTMEQRVTSLENRVARLEQQIADCCML